MRPAQLIYTEIAEVPGLPVRVLEVSVEPTDVVVVLVVPRDGRQPGDGAKAVGWMAEEIETLVEREAGYAGLGFEVVGRRPE